MGIVLKFYLFSLLILMPPSLSELGIIQQQLWDLLNRQDIISVKFYNHKYAYVRLKGKDLIEQREIDKLPLMKIPLKSL